MNGPPHDFPPEALATQPKAKTRDPLDWHDLAGKIPPQRRWAINGWVGFDHVTLLVGPGGIGKTLLTQQMLSCLALGKPFIGNIDEPRKCLMWACEDDHDELWRRQIHIAKWCNAGIDAFADRLVIVPRHGLDNTLVSTEYGRLLFTPLLEQLAEQARDTGAEVVAIDNAGQTYGAGENDRHAVTVYLNALTGALPGLAVMLLAHPSRSAGSEFSGSGAWENVARTRLYLGASLPGEKPDPDTEPQDHVRFLARRKANYSQRDWRRMTYAEGALTVEEPEHAGSIVASIRSANAERTVISGITKLAQKGVHTTDGSRSTNFLPKTILDYKLNEGLSRQDLTSAMRALILDGRVKRDQIGKRDNRTPLFGLVVASDPAQ